MFKNIFGGNKKENLENPVVPETNTIKVKENNKEPTKKEKGFFSRKQKKKPDAVLAETAKEGGKRKSSNPFKKIKHFFQFKAKKKETVVATETPINEKSTDEDEKNPFYSDMIKAPENEDEKNPFYFDMIREEPKIVEDAHDKFENSRLTSTTKKREEVVEKPKRKLETILPVAKEPNLYQSTLQVNYLKDEIARTKNTLESALEERDNTRTLLDRALLEVDRQKGIAEHRAEVIEILEREIEIMSLIEGKDDRNYRLAQVLTRLITLKKM